MADLEITEEEAEELLAMDKISTSTDPVELPDLGGRADMPFASIDRREEFCISFTRSAIILEKRNHHLRGRKVLPLARLDLDETRTARKSARGTFTSTARGTDSNTPSTCRRVCSGTWMTTW